MGKVPYDTERDSPDRADGEEPNALVGTSLARGALGERS